MKKTYTHVAHSKLILNFSKTYIIATPEVEFKAKNPNSSFIIDTYYFCKQKRNYFSNNLYISLFFFTQNNIFIHHYKYIKLNITSKILILIFCYIHSIS